jgi:thiopeptide-type bacteriocin biosynthesis protein
VTLVDARPGATTWSSWHLHLASNARSVQDRVLREVVAPLAGRLDGKPWFFIRYWQAGIHLRLRVGDLDPAEFADVERSLQDGLAITGVLRPGEEPVDEKAYYAEAAAHAATERGANSVVQQLLPPGVHRAVYEPEDERYGGSALMPRTERLFQLSSELVLRVLPADGDLRALSALAVRGTMAAATALGDPAEYYARSLDAWRQWGEASGWNPAQIDRLFEVGELPGARPDPYAHGPFAAWHTALGDLAAEITRTPAQPPQQILFSHVHMLHNRLGRNLFEELRTYAWLAAAFPEEARR